MPDLIGALSFILSVTALIMDELLTKISMRLGCRETNPLFNFLVKKKLKEKYVHLLFTIIGSSLFLCLYLFLDNNLLLLYLAVGMYIPVVLNALTLLEQVNHIEPILLQPSKPLENTVSN